MGHPDLQVVTAEAGTIVKAVTTKINATIDVVTRWVQVEEVDEDEDEEVQAVEVDAPKVVTVTVTMAVAVTAIVTDETAEMAVDAKIGALHVKLSSATVLVATVTIATIPTTG
jgi:hypothetical protein